uniref:O-methyltransferase C-terminal domain-containing protein n=1 Tax=Mycena chlorophos TaxID=658473 RepID=A0ABQ0L0R6_MYCCL|nr:predicted protein [Mycena chlorophos]
MAANGISTLRALLNVMSDAVDTIEGVYTSANLPIPSLNEPYNPSDPSEALRADPIVAAASTNLIAAAAQITATVRNPVHTAVLTTCYFHIASAVRVASELNVVEILREAGPQGMHLNDIAAKCHVHSDVLGEWLVHPGSTPQTTNVGLIGEFPNCSAQILRMLATWHIFRELSPSVFSNNKISSTMDKGKPSAVLVARYPIFFKGSIIDGTSVEMNGSLPAIPRRKAQQHWLSGGMLYLLPLEYFSNLFLCSGDEIFKASAYLAETIRDPDGDPVSLKRAFSFQEPSIFEWHNLPENKYRRDRFALAMHSTVTAQSHELIFQGFDWGALSAGSTLVDVGSGVGSTPLAVAQRYPGIKVVLQDLAETIEAAKRVHLLVSGFKRNPT